MGFAKRTRWQETAIAAFEGDDAVRNIGLPWARTGDYFVFSQAGELLNKEGLDVELHATNFQREPKIITATDYRGYRRHYLFVKELFDQNGVRYILSVHLPGADVTVAPETEEE